MELFETLSSVWMGFCFLVMGIAMAMPNKKAGNIIGSIALVSTVGVPFTVLIIVGIVSLFM